MWNSSDVRFRLFKMKCMAWKVEKRRKHDKHLVTYRLSGGNLCNEIDHKSKHAHTSVHLVRIYCEYLRSTVLRFAAHLDILGIGIQVHGEWIFVAGQHSTWSSTGSEWYVVWILHFDFHSFISTENIICDMSTCSLLSASEKWKIFS